MLPSRYNASISLEDAREMARLVGVRYDEIAIEPMFRSFLTALEPEFRGRAVDATEENIQARIRGTLLMALSNKFGWIVLATGNKSELSVGYSTLYGDMVGGFAPLKDVFKTRVYELARWRNHPLPVTLHPGLDRQLGLKGLNGVARLAFFPESDHGVGHEQKENDEEVRPMLDHAR